MNTNPTLYAIRDKATQKYLTSGYYTDDTALVDFDNVRIKLAKSIRAAKSIITSATKHYTRNHQYYINTPILGPYQQYYARFKKKPKELEIVPVYLTAGTPI